MSPKVFIIILNWNQWHLTEDCLKSLRDIDYDNYQVVLIDNNSDQKAPAEILSKLLSDLILIENKENLGFAGGNNVGIKYALENRADYILLLNNDTLIEDKSFLKKIVEIAESDQKIGIIGPKIYYFQKESIAKKSPKIWFGGGKLNWLKTEATHLEMEERGKTDFTPLERKPFFLTGFITGCCLLIKREVIEKIGLMPEEFFLYFEDADWCLKAQEAGYECVYAPSAWIWHKVASSTGEFSYNYIYYNTRNGLLLGWRHGNFFHRLIIFFLGWWIIKKQLIKILFNYKKEWSEAMLHGAWDFLRGQFGKLR